MTCAGCRVESLVPLQTHSTHSQWSGMGIQSRARAHVGAVGRERRIIMRSVRMVPHASGHLNEPRDRQHEAEARGCGLGRGLRRNPVSVCMVSVAFLFSEMANQDRKGIALTVAKDCKPCLGVDVPDHELDELAALSVARLQARHIAALLPRLIRNLAAGRHP